MVCILYYRSVVCIVYGVCTVILYIVYVYKVIVYGIGIWYTCLYGVCTLIVYGITLVL